MSRSSIHCANKRTRIMSFEMCVSRKLCRRDKLVLGTVRVVDRPRARSSCSKPERQNGSQPTLLFSRTSRYTVSST